MGTPGIRSQNTTGKYKAMNSYIEMLIGFFSLPGIALTPSWHSPAWFVAPPLGRKEESGVCAQYCSLEGYPRNRLCLICLEVLMYSLFYVQSIVNVQAIWGLLKAKESMGSWWHRWVCYRGFHVQHDSGEAFKLWLSPPDRKRRGEHVPRVLTFQRAVGGTGLNSSLLMCSIYRRILPLFELENEIITF